MNAPVESKLLPCPFCGGEAHLWPVIMPFDADCDTITVQCSQCDAIGANVLVDQGVHAQSDLPELEAEAITAWNTRDQVAELVEAVQWAFDTLIELNPSNYDHDNVCEVNAAAVEVMLGLKPILASHKGEQP